MEISRTSAVASYVVMPLVDAANRPTYKDTPTIAAGDCVIIRHTGGAWNVANIGTTPAYINVTGAKTQVLFTLTATELTSDDLDYPIIIKMVDQTATKEWDDTEVVIWTKNRVANVTALDGVALGTHASGMIPADVRDILGTAVSSPATAGVLDVNVKNMNNVAATSITTINANQGSTQPLNFTGTGASALVKTDMVDVAGAAVSTSSAQIGVNVVSQANIDFGALQKASLNAATPASVATVTNLTNERGKYMHGAVWISAAGASGTTSYTHGIMTNPVTGIADAKSIADNLLLKKFYVQSGTTVTLIATMANYVFDGYGWLLALGGREISNAVFMNCRSVTGVSSSSAPGNTPNFINCEFGAATIPASNLHNCEFNTGTITLVGGGNYDFVDCASVVPGTSTPVFNVNSVAGTNISFRRWSGGITINGITTDTVISIDMVSGGTVTLAGAGGNVQIRGMTAGVTDNRTGSPTLGTNAVINQTTIATPTNITAGTITTVTNVTNDVGITQAGADKVWGTTVRTITAFSTSLAVSVWDVLLSNISTSLSIGKKLKDWVLGTDNKVLLSTDAQSGVTIPTVTAVTNRVTANMDQISGAAVNTSLAQIGANVVSAGGVTWDYAQIITDITSGIWGAPRASFVADGTMGQTQALLDSGTAQTGSSGTTIKLRSGASATNDLYINAIVQIIGGTGINQSAIIDGYDGSTKVASISSTWAVTPDNSSVYVIKPMGAIAATVSGTVDANIVEVDGAALATHTSGYVPTESSVTGTVDANIVSIDGDLTSGNNATLSLKALDIRNTEGNAVTIKSTSDNGIDVEAGTSAIKLAGMTGLQILATSTGVSINSDSVGVSIRGVDISTILNGDIGLSVDANDLGISIVSGVESGDGAGIRIESHGAPAIDIDSTGEGVKIVATLDGILSESTGTGDGIRAVGGTNKSGLSLLKGTGTGNDLNLETPETNLPFPAFPSTIDANVISINGEVTAAELLQLSAMTMASDTIDDSNFLPTVEEFECSSIVDADLAHYSNRWIIFTSGPLARQARLIQNYLLSSGKGHFVCDAFTDIPANGDGFIIV